MELKTYLINKGLNRSLEFKGIKAQYLLYLGIGLVGLLLLFAMLYISGLPSLVCAGTVLSLGVLLWMVVQQVSIRYGEHGWMKMMAQRKLPPVLKVYDRQAYYFKNVSNSTR